MITRVINQSAELAIRALNGLRGDDLFRAEHSFKHKTTEQMQEQYGQSGRTCQQILDGYRQRSAEIDAAIRWVESKSHD